MRTKEEIILKAVNDLKNSEFKATAVKVELEGQLDRGDGGYCDNCDEGYNSCNSCSEGFNECGECYGNWVGEGDNQDCEFCDEGYIRCDYECDEGYFTCSECDGDWDRGDSGEWSDEDNCYAYIMEKLEPLGLSEQIDDRWIVKHPLRFARFYNDGSVDSEFTFTIMLDDPKNIHLLPKVIEAWNDLVAEIGNGISTIGAGMHIALINTKSGVYPTSNAPMLEHFKNFKKSMQLLLPALFLLASPNNASRGLGYRRPEIGYDSHRSAVDYRRGALEFRVFETCYDNPEQILDNIVVISKCMRYWTRKFKSSGMEKITPEIYFGNDGQGDINRMYGTIQHIDVLNAGLAKLKPDYLTITEVKRQRQFKQNKRKIAQQLRERKVQAEAEFKEYEERFKWSLIVTEQQAKARHMEQYLTGAPMDKLTKLTKAELEAEAEKYAKQRVESRRQDLVSKEPYIESKINDFIRACRGGHRLTA